ncbi:discoidin domain-containing protein [Streptomyces sp. BE20]|uniref:discoidin domain-containing protein n=1 Tax=Streptomyces sp. BE20 TaxID=3002525 RepID=UPI002E77FF2F|nr:discoidin domain-containing protein [Streptomyces sp. BE20]MEE1827332.1 discoidin domain-containing protein [Streptomyces sp. BE20]
MDSIWRDGEDAGQTGDGSPQEKYVNYRDSQTFRNIANQNPLFPIPSVMNHGIIFSDRAPQFSADHDLTKQSVRNEVSNDIRSYFAQGMGLQELYVRNTLVRPNLRGAPWFWDTLAANAKWARTNQDLLADVRWIGGDAAAGDIYGTAAWKSTAGTSKGMLMLRNPSATPKTFAVDPQQIFELPGGTQGTYRFTEKDGLRAAFTAQRGTPAGITLQPHEVAVFEAAPITGTTAYTAIPRDGWTATADSIETVRENGQATNAIDGNDSTIRHTQYGTGITPMPHWIDIDLGRSRTVGRLDYLPRQDGGTNGTMADYQILTSTDGNNAGTSNTTSMTEEPTHPMVGRPLPRPTLRAPHAHSTPGSAGGACAGGRAAGGWAAWMHGPGGVWCRVIRCTVPRASTAHSTSAATSRRAMRTIPGPPPGRSTVRPTQRDQAGSELVITAPTPIGRSAQTPGVRSHGFPNW